VFKKRNRRETYIMDDRDNSPVSVESVAAADDFFINLARDPVLLDKVLSTLPRDINEFLTSADFEMSCEVRAFQNTYYQKKNIPTTFHTHTNINS
jgi:hypothetical protein